MNDDAPSPKQDKLAVAPSQQPDKPETAAPPKDVVFVHSPSEDGGGFRVVRKREDTIEVGEIRTLQEGRPIRGEVVTLTRRKEHERLFDVDVVVPREEVQSGAPRNGPAQVATDTYRDNWEAIFGRKEARALN
jgi:hypothetical protein